MKKTFLTRRNALFSSARLSWGALACCLAGVLLVLRLIAPNLFLHLFAPAFRVSDALAEKSTTLFAGFHTAGTLAHENERLVAENRVVTLQNEMLIEKLTTIAQLPRGPHDIVAGVVARPPESPYDTLVLAAGSTSGVIPGMEVLGVGEVPLGIVSSVLSDFSRVTLFSAPGVSTSGSVGRGKLPIILIGRGGGALNASVSHATELTVGDVVSVPGPGLLPIGVITRIDSDPSSPAMTLRIVPALNPFSLDWVIVRESGATVLNHFSSSTPLTP